MEVTEVFWDSCGIFAAANDLTVKIVEVLVDFVVVIEHDGIIVFGVVDCLEEFHVGSSFREYRVYLVEVGARTAAGDLLRLYCCSCFINQTN